MGNELISQRIFDLKKQAKYLIARIDENDLDFAILDAQAVAGCYIKIRELHRVQAELNGELD